MTTSLHFRLVLATRRRQLAGVQAILTHLASMVESASTGIISDALVTCGSLRNFAVDCSFADRDSRDHRPRVARYKYFTLLRDRVCRISYYLWPRLEPFGCS